MYKTTDYPWAHERDSRFIGGVVQDALARRPLAGASEKLRSIVEQPTPTYRIPPFLGKAEIPLGVASSVVRRHTEIWGRYE